MNFLYIFLLTFLLISCTQNKSNEQMLEERADSFATAYFNYQFKEAKKHVDTPSEKWLQYAATNVTQEDVDILKKQENGASVTINDIIFSNMQETQADVHITVHNFLQHDSIGKSGQMIEDAKFILKAYQENGRWFIKMEDLPQSGK